MNPLLWSSIAVNAVAAILLLTWLITSRHLRHFAVAVVALLVIAGGVLFARYLIMTRPKPKRQEAVRRAAIVETMKAERTSVDVTVTAMGTVVPAERIVVQPQVSGRIIWQNPKLVPGGILKEDEKLVKIDPRDYKYLAEQREAAVERAEFELRVEEGRQTVARREWELLRPEQRRDESGAELALRKPHIKNLRAAKRAAESALKEAKLKVERTTIDVPFNALVQSEEVDDGQIVSPQSRIATLVGTDRFWVRASVPVDRLPWIRIPGVNGEEGSKATVIHDMGGGVRIVRQATVTRLMADLDAAGRMARVLLTVEDPLSLRSETERLPLLIGAYVRVDIEGTKLEKVVTVPRKAVHEGDQVWIMGADDRLDIRKVEIRWRRSEDVLVSSGITEGERIVLSRIPSPTPGMRLREQNGTAEGQAGRDEPLLARKDDPDEEPEKEGRP